MMGAYWPGNAAHWMVDNCMMPLWSNVIDFQSTAVLVCVLTGGYKLFGYSIKPLLILSVLSLAARAVIVSTDPGCLNLTAGLTVWHPNSFLMTGTKGGVKYLESVHGVSLVPEKIHLPACTMMNDNFSFNCSSQMYLPMHARINSFLPGALTAWNFANLEDHHSATASKWFGRFFSDS